MRMWFEPKEDKKVSELSTKINGTKTTKISQELNLSRNPYTFSDDIKTVTKRKVYKQQ